MHALLKVGPLLLCGFDRLHPARQVFMCCRTLTPFDEGADDENVHLHRALALEDGREHSDTRVRS